MSRWTLSISLESNVCCSQLCSSLTVDSKKKYKVTWPIDSTVHAGKSSFNGSAYCSGLVLWFIHIAFSMLNVCFVGTGYGKLVRKGMDPPLLRWLTAALVHRFCLWLGVGLAPRCHGVRRGGRSAWGKGNEQQKADEEHYCHSMAHVLQYRHDGRVCED